MSSIKLYTIGFTKKSAEGFFSMLRDAGAKGIIDVRLGRSSQLAGFAKEKDLVYFLKAIGGMDYVQVPELAPTKEILDAYKKRGGAWDEYERRFLDLMAERRIEDIVSPDLLDHRCLLCSEHEPHYCHRRLVAEYLGDRLDVQLEVRHLQ